MRNSCDYIDAEEGRPAPLDADQIVFRLQYHLRGAEVFELLEDEWDDAARECGIDPALLTDTIQSRVMTLVFQDQIADRIDAEKRADEQWEDTQTMETGADRCPVRE